LISVIIPTLNEATALPATLQKVFEQKSDFEVIVSDGGSADNTLELCQQYPQIKIVNAARGRASQMNAGVFVASGDWLLFLHADAILPDNALPLIQQQTVEAGGFKHKFSGKKWALRVVSWLHNFRCSRTGVFYGDQAMFIRRKLFNELGGFPNVKHLEDLLFSEAIRKRVKPIFLQEEVISDSRKFEQQGVWLSLFRVIQIQLCHELNLEPPTRKFFASIR